MNKVISSNNYSLLKTIVNENIEDYLISVQDPNKKGEGYSGELCFVSLKHKHTGESLDFIIKQAFTDEKVRELQRIRSIFLTEIHFYTKLWPSLQKFQSDKSLPNIFDNIPKCFITCSEEGREALILENLRSQNFETCDKKAPLDKEHFEYILKQYGKFHGVAFAYKLLKPQEYREMTKDLEGMFDHLRERTPFIHYVKYIYDISLKSLDPQKDAKAIEKFKAYVDHPEDVICDKANYSGDYATVLHGDCWSNNIMFKYDKSKRLCDIRLIDFQFTQTGTPVHDLSYCIYSGASKEILDELDHYLRIYHISLLETLDEFGLNSGKIYPFEALKRDWKEYCHPGFSMGLMLWRMKLTYDPGDKHVADEKDEDVLSLESSTYDVKTFNTRSRDLILHMFENDFF